MILEELIVRLRVEKENKKYEEIIPYAANKAVARRGWIRLGPPTPRFGS